MAPEYPAGWSKRPSCEAAASEEANAYAVRYVEPLSDARTKLAVFFNILLGKLGSSVQRRLMCNDRLVIAPDKLSLYKTTVTCDLLNRFHFLSSRTL